LRNRAFARYERPDNGSGRGPGPPSKAGPLLLKTAAKPAEANWIFPGRIPGLKTMGARDGDPLSPETLVRLSAYRPVTMMTDGFVGGGNSRERTEGEILECSGFLLKAVKVPS